LNAAKPGAYLGYDGLLIGAAILAIASLIILMKVAELKPQPGTEKVV
jgi:hypothetical protein